MVICRPHRGLSRMKLSSTGAFPGVRVFIEMSKGARAPGVGGAAPCVIVTTTNACSTQEFPIRHWPCVPASWFE